MSQVVTLDWPELYAAAQMGVQRQIQNLRRGRVDAHGFEGAGWDQHITGASAEQAVAKLVNVYYNGNLGNLDADDAGRLQVRSTPLAKGSLILHPSDPDDRLFVLVTGAGREWTVRGWIMARDGKQQRFWSDRGGKGREAFFVPQSALSTDFGALREASVAD